MILLKMNEKCAVVGPNPFMSHLASAVALSISVVGTQDHRSDVEVYGIGSPMQRANPQHAWVEIALSKKGCVDALVGLIITKK